MSEQPERKREKQLRPMVVRPWDRTHGNFGGQWGPAVSRTPTQHLTPFYGLGSAQFVYFRDLICRLFQAQNIRERQKRSVPAICPLFATICLAEQV